MRHDQAQWIAVLGGKLLPVMMGGKQHIVMLQITERNIRRVSLLCMNQNKMCFRPGSSNFQYIDESDTVPRVIEAAPARHAMKIALHPGSRELFELFPI